jgi:rhamnosyl/mannosyltransferase
MTSQIMRVLQVYKDFYPPVCGGIERHIHDLVVGLPPLGVHCDVLVAARSLRAREEWLSANGNGAAPARVVKVGEWCRVLSAPVAPGFSSWLGRLAPQYDLLHFHFPNPTAEIGWLLADAATPAVVTYHSDIVRQRLSGRVYRPLLRRFLEGVSRILVPSPQLLESSPILATLRAKCAVVPFGVEPAHYAPVPEVLHRAGEVRARLTGGDSQEVVFLFVGRFRYYKGLTVLLDALARLRQSGVGARLVLLGEGPEENALRARVHALGLAPRVSFVPHVSEEELVAHYRAADAVVLPSIARSEAFGIVLLEAMACGKPVISTELGTASSWVNQHARTGLVVAPRDAAALAAAMETLARDAKLRAHFGAAGRERVSKLFSRQQMLEAVRGQYVRAVGRAEEMTATTPSSNPLGP